MFYTLQNMWYSVNTVTVVLFEHVFNRLPFFSFQEIKNTDNCLSVIVSLAMNVIDVVKKKKKMFTLFIFCLKYVVFSNCLRISLPFFSPTI